MKNDFTNDNQVVFYTDPPDYVLWQIANQNGAIADKVFRGLKHTITRACAYTGFVMAIMCTGDGSVLGCANFIQNSKQSSQWLYTDLWITPESRRQGNAIRLLQKSIDYMQKHGADSLLCTVSPENLPSLKTQKSLGFKEIPLKPFEFFETDGLLMFELRL